MELSVWWNMKLPEHKFFLSLVPGVGPDQGEIGLGQYGQGLYIGDLYG